MAEMQREMGALHSALQAVAPVWTLSLLSHHHHHLFLLHPTLSCNPTSLKKRVASNTQQEKQDILVAVTLRDLQAVKLRKVIVSSVKSKRTLEKMHAPLVTVADLQNVRLKQSHCQLPPKLLKRLSFGRTPTKSPMNLRTQLKRIQINRLCISTLKCFILGFLCYLNRKSKDCHQVRAESDYKCFSLLFRSPGGTPLFDKENMETGTGLAPIMTQALRRKFQSALPRGLSPKAKNLNESSDQN
ncbi:proline-rich protein 11-like isoform X1 [Oncorhynchus nerka]|uniref:proline-rich protein 11-like isoform X1 n=1 Tax=Oncorhynchus nerka TaxID=8023 RepID=UPI00113190B3|nr:proline-rich protein 11-like isoform X1 [Oncorhynchus nerka]